MTQTTRIIALQNGIESLLNALGNKTPQDCIDRWNFITDIDTNDIRLEGYDAAIDLYADLYELYFGVRPDEPKVIPDDGFSDGGEPYTDEELDIINKKG